MTDFRLHRAFVLIVACLFGGIIGTVLGFDYRSDIQKKLDKLPKARPVVQNPPAFALPCTEAGRIEHSRICRARYRSTEVGR